MHCRTTIAATLICISTSAALFAEPATQTTETQSVQVSNNATNSPAPFSIAFYWENDGSILKYNNAQDRHYTNGNAITIAHQPDWAEGFADVATFGETFDTTAAGYILGHMIFTPDNINTTQLIRNDRPYAGYLFAGVYLQRANDDTFDHIQLDLGTVGPASQADHIQRDIHEWLDLDEPQGWQNQLHDEFTAQLYLRRKWRMDLETISIFDTEIQHQLIPQVELAAGSVYRNASAGAIWRIGHNLPDDFGPGRLADVRSETGSTPHNTGGYGFVRVTGRVVEHDLFLEGNSYKESHGVNAETFVGEIQAGFAVYHRYKGWLFNANYSQTFVSEQFEGQDGSDAYASVMLAASKGF
ncbi:MAG: lipid A deacylase LpxR family protein [Phycisphaerales bacterium]